MFQPGDVWYHHFQAEVFDVNNLQPEDFRIHFQPEGSLILTFPNDHYQPKKPRDQTAPSGSALGRLRAQGVLVQQVPDSGEMKARKLKKPQFRCSKLWWTYIIFGLCLRCISTSAAIIQKFKQYRIPEPLSLLFLISFLFLVGGGGLPERVVGLEKTGASRAQTWGALLGSGFQVRTDSIGHEP